MALGRCIKEASVAWRIERLVLPSECCLWWFILLIAIYSQVLMTSFLHLFNRSDWSKLLSNSVGWRTLETRSSGHRSKVFRPVAKGYVCLVAQSCPTLCNPWTAAHQASLSMGILQAKILEWIAMPSSRRSSQPRDRSQVSCIVGGFFTIWATREALRKGG